MPITWRNVGATVRGGDGSSNYRGAEDSFQGGFDALQKVLDKRQQTSRSNYGTEQENTVADYLDKVAQANSTEGVAGLRGDQELASLRGQLNGKYAGQVRGAVDERETDVIEQTRARQKFGDDQWLRKNEDQLAQLEQQAINGDLKGAMAGAEALDMPGTVDYIRELHSSFNTADDQRIAQEENQQNWVTTGLAQNRDARSGEIHDFTVNNLQEAEDAEDRTELIQGMARRAAVNSPSGSTDARQNLIAALNDQDATLAEVQGATEEFDARTSGQYELSSEDQARYERKQDNIRSEYNLDNNPITRTVNMSAQDRTDAAMNLVRNSRSEGYLSEEGNDDVIRVAYDTMADYMNNGVMDSQGERVPVPPEVLELAMESSGDAFWEADTKFDERIIEIMEAQGLDVSIEEHQVAQEELQRLDMEVEQWKNRPQSR